MGQRLPFREWVLPACVLLSPGSPLKVCRVKAFLSDALVGRMRGELKHGAHLNPAIRTKEIKRTR